LAQAQAQALFEIAHLLADRRTTDAQHTFRCGKAAAFDHAAEDPQQADIKVTDLRERVWATGAHSLVKANLKIRRIGFFRLYAHGTFARNKSFVPRRQQRSLRGP
jgi:hypothetical protein